VRSNRDAGLARDAQRFADTAQDFHDEVKARASRDELRNRFSRVSQHYHALRDEMRGEHPNRGEQASFDEVTRAYLDLERELEVRVSGL
jgi:hypothetical protein